ncbi:RsmB/NOP family class I SAM-dependent RNA methyltransferase [Paenibacillus cisolokensis]|uniref:RsmB/NOP family class I SAM-dependent RNA methyltransferase n=1 Tax=Paenibacillus cisolokensis TaxID=1658519 RepID=UPI003D2E1428
MGEEKLPAAFVSGMKELAGETLDEFLDSYNAPRTHGLRLNRLKSDGADQAVRALISMFELTPVPWCADGYYYEETMRPGRHPYHAAGLYYIQEPSAMSAVEMLNPQPGETILDLAAAPGGKTSHIASKMTGKGLLVSNEIHPERARILAENVERMGIDNAVVTCAAPDELARRFPASFDRIMLDAPCSGEGMFRKDPGAIEEWSPALVELCVARQWDIIQEAYVMLKPGGTLAYSTCTFNKAENEEMVERMLAQYPDLELLKMERFWPHLQRGEGHFVAVVRKRGGASDELEGGVQDTRPAGRGGKRAKQAPEQAAYQAFLEWAREDLPGFVPTSGRPLLFGDELYWLPENASWTWTERQLRGLKIPRAGLHLAHLKKNRIEPAHALAMASRPEQAARSWNLSADSPEIAAFLRGETLPVDPDYRGWTLVTTDGLPVGWGKASSGQLKNHLPKGLRSLR